MESLPNPNNTKMLYYILQLRRATLEFCYGDDVLINLQNKALDIINPNFEQKVLFFDEISSKRRGKGYLEVLGLNDFNTDIMIGHNITTINPFNSVLIFSRLGSFHVSFEKNSLQNLSKVLAYTTDVMGISALSSIR